MPIVRTRVVRTALKVQIIHGELVDSYIPLEWRLFETIQIFLELPCKIMALGIFKGIWHFKADYLVEVAVQQRSYDIHLTGF